MLEKIRLERSNNTDLNMYQCGIEDCSPGHFWGPAVRDHYLMHYVLSGKGCFTVNNQTYYLKKGDGFLICPDVIAYYQADETEPWTYSWVGFYGLRSEYYLKKIGLTATSPVFTYSRDSALEIILQKMISANTIEKSRDVHMLGLLYMFLANLIEVSTNNVLNYSTENNKELYVRKALEYIEINYFRKITILEIAKYIGLNRSYFCSIFSQLTGKAPQDFLIAFRIDKACELMANDALSIGDISRSVGYEDPLAFSKAFRKHRNMSPREFRLKRT